MSCTRLLATLTKQSRIQQQVCRSFASSRPILADNRLDTQDVQAVDPFLQKLQNQTEASYLELLSRQKKVTDLDEDDRKEEEEIERRARERGEWGGPKGPEPTRFGDWEKGGRCTDF